MSNGNVYYRGGPKDGQVLLGSDEPGFLRFDGQPPALYRLTDETIDLPHGTYPIADYIHDQH